ncbi:unnamed protein product [Trifolium pratense]|uniref:Uncharacterized protein n=1 Tax=Trifolium pratense TaxID=57577 RepID=A0ACB0K278_TRIPR|nr:unnamed protein product [Trifolium pratense]
MNAFDMIEHLKTLYQEQARIERFEVSKAFFQAKLAEGSSVSPHVLKMIGYVGNLAKLGFPLSDELATDLILQSLSESFNQFVLNFTMSDMEKTLPQLLNMLRQAEQNMRSKGKSNQVLMIGNGSHKKGNKGKEFVEAQTRINKEVNEAFMKLNTKVESLEANSKAIVTHISLLAQTSLGSFTKSHVDVITTNESQNKNPKESDNEINEKSNEKNIEIEKIPPTPPKEEGDKEVEKKPTYILPPPYNPPTPFTQRLVEAKGESQSKRDVEELKNINTNAPLYEIPYKKRNLEDNREIISVEKGRVDFEVGNEEIKPSPEKLIIKIDPEPPPHVQTSEPPYMKKKIKSEGYGRWVDKWRWKPKLIRSLIGDSRKYP